MDKEVKRELQVAYLFNGVRAEALERVRAGDNPGDGFWGMVRLPHYGIKAEHLEIEQIFPSWLSAYVRKHLPIHYIHIPLFFSLLKFDAIFSSAAFGTQLLWTLWPGKKPLWVMHDFSIMGLIGERKTLRQKLFAWMVSRCSGIVAIGKDETRKLKEYFPHLSDRITYITFGVDLAFFRPRAGEPASQVLAVGFDPDRDWNTLVSALRDIPVRVVVATRPGRIEHLLPLPENIVQTTFTPRELADEYARAEIFVLPLDTRTGVNDAMGCSSLFEAMAAGCAIVASDTHTMRSYVVEGENGMLVSERDPQELKEQVLRLHANPELRARLGRNARAYAEEHLDSEKLAAELAAFLYKLYERRAKTASS